MGAMHDGYARTSSSPDKDPWRSPAEGPSRSAASTEGRLVVFGMICFGVVLLVRLGPALLGQQVLAGTDILQNLFPWSDGVPEMRPQNWHLGDSVDNALPSYLEAFRQLWAGHLELWSSLTGPGRRMLVIGSMPMMTPVSVWWILLPTSYAVGFVKLTQLVVAFAGMALWLRRVGASWAAGVFAGLLYVGSGFLTAWSNWPSQSATACMVPALFWVVERLAQRRTLLASLPVALVVTFLLLGAFPATAGHALYAAGLYFLVRLIAGIRQRGPADTVRTFALGVMAVVLGIGMAAFQLLATLGNLGDTDLGYRNAQFYSEQPFRSLLSVLFPQAMNDAGYPQSNPIEAYAYVGMAAVVLAMMVIVSGRFTGVQRGVRTFLVVGTLLAAALVWQQGFWTDWMADLPVFSGNNSGRIRDMVTVFLCALGGVGFHLLQRADLPRRVRARVAATGVLGLLLMGAVSAAAWFRYGHLFKRPGEFVQDIVIGLTATALVVLAASLVRSVRARAAALGLLVAVTSVATLVATDYFYPTVDDELFYPEDSLIAAAQQQVGSGRLLAVGGFMGSSGAAYGLRTLTGHTFYPTSWAEVLRTLDPKAFAGPGRTTSNPALSLAPESGKLSNPLLDRMSVTTVYASPGRSIPGNVYLPDGAPADGRRPGSATVPLSPDSTVTTALAGQPMRAVRLRIAAPVSGKGDDLTVGATITDDSGSTVASGSLTRGNFGTKPFDIPLTGGSAIPEDHARYTLSLTLTAEAPGYRPTADVLLEQGGDTPWIRIVGPADDGLELVYGDEHGVLWKRLTALPRIRWASRSIVEPELMPRLTRLVDPSTPRDAVVLSAPGPEPSGRPAQLDVETDASDEVSVRVDARGAGYLVVADGIQSGYRATVDGNPTDIVDADHAVGAVFVPEGSHLVTVSFTGAGLHLKAGFAISGASVVIVILLCVCGWWWNRRRRRSDGTGPDGDDAGPGEAATPADGTALASDGNSATAPITGVTVTPGAPATADPPPRPS